MYETESLAFVTGDLQLEDPNSHKVKVINIRQLTESKRIQSQQDFFQNTRSTSSKEASVLSRPSREGNQNLEKRSSSEGKPAEVVQKLNDQKKTTEQMIEKLKDNIECTETLQLLKNPREVTAASVIPVETKSTEELEKAGRRIKSASSQSEGERNVQKKHEKDQDKLKVPKPVQNLDFDDFLSDLLGNLKL